MKLMPVFLIPLSTSHDKLHGYQIVLQQESMNKLPSFIGCVVIIMKCFVYFEERATIPNGMLYGLVFSTHYVLHDFRATAGGTTVLPSNGFRPVVRFQFAKLSPLSAYDT